MFKILVNQYLSYIDIEKNYIEKWLLDLYIIFIILWDNLYFFKVQNFLVEIFSVLVFFVGEVRLYREGAIIYVFYILKF